jgi:hypothetical protein
MEKYRSMTQVIHGAYYMPPFGVVWECMVNISGTDTNLLESEYENNPIIMAFLSYIFLFNILFHVMEKINQKKGLSAFLLLCFAGKIKAVIFEGVELFLGSTMDTIQKGSH